MRLRSLVFHTAQRLKTSCRARQAARMLRAEGIEVGRPRYKHPCVYCIFLGHYQPVVGSNPDCDLYYCPQDYETIVIRFSDRLDDCSSALIPSGFRDDLAEAHRRALRARLTKRRFLARAELLEQYLTLPPDQPFIVEMSRLAGGALGYAIRRNRLNDRESVFAWLRLAAEETELCA